MMWLHAELDVLIVTSYAPNRSFQNMVELLFGWVSQRLAGNVISEDPDAAMLDIRNLVDGMRDGYSVLCDIPPDGPPADWPSYDTLPAFTRSSNKQIRSDESLREVYERFLFFLDHCDRRTNLLAFIRCSKKNCPCAKKPWRAKRFRAELDHLKGLPTPIPHPAHADHFLSYAEHREQRLNADPDTHQPSFAKCPGRCTLCRYVFKSENDKAVHNRLRHPRSGSLLNE
uniref:C2H2-type domain-containing protein n=1 Tax=Eutreptiella gymnastica TaxID=73025 RepID=A0A7S4CZ70_9EUGL